MVALAGHGPRPGRRRARRLTPEKSGRARHTAALRYASASTHMTKLGAWRVIILVATLACVVMLFAPLVAELFERLAEPPTGLP